MRKLYLIRHAEPLSGEGRCMSKTDLPLDETGIYQSERLREWARMIRLTEVFSSPLGRCVQTARIMSDGCIPVQTCEQLHEMDVGEWENQTFDEIRTRYADVYAARGRHPGTVPPPGGESIDQAGARLIRCLDGLMEETQGNIAVVAHGGVNRGALCRIMGLPSDEALGICQPWGGISTLHFTGNGQWVVVSVGEKPDRFPAADERERLLVKLDLPVEVRKHCSAVTNTALSLAAQVNVIVDTDLLRAACDLHDLAKMEGSHTERGAEILRQEGYPDVAALVAAHHDLPSNAGVEAQLLYLADKLVDGTENVPLNYRFEVSREKCRTQEALESWNRRFKDALDIMERYHLTAGS
jgi:putative nucleotidyltransferase with HDIG domain